jgi:DNA helicase HerA-like ATPase
MSEPILIGRAGKAAVALLPAMANRHGLIAGATGTGKTATLQGLAEGLSAAGVPVFLADVKGDLAGLSQLGRGDARLMERAKKTGPADFRPAAFPVMFWDLLALQGHPLRTTLSELGPLLLARLLGLNEVQEGVLALAFKLADDEGLLLLDLKDLRALLAHIAERASELTSSYGMVSVQSIGAIQRALLQLEEQGGAGFFGEPALNLADLLLCDAGGRGAINVLAADQLMLRPKLYATFLLWLLSELFETLPEAGDLEKPKLVFFFDEAHLLFKDSPPALVEKVEQVVRLIRSKGVGVFFVTQSPLDIPESVLGQLGNRVQHALRAFTPKDQRLIRAVAETFRASPGLDTEAAISELAIGEALVSTLDERGSPMPVQRCLIRPPASRMGAITPAERAAIIGMSPVSGRYDEALDRESAFEILSAPPPLVTSSNPWGQAAGKAAEAMGLPNPWGAPSQPAPPPPAGSRLPPTMPRPAPRAPAARGRPPQTVTEIAMKGVVRSISSSIGSAIGRQIVRGVLGSILKR